MKKQTGIIILSIILVALVVALVIGLTGSETGRTVKEKQIKIGASLPLSGKIAYMGQHMQEGIDLAVSEINAKGGINGKPIKIVYDDTQGTTKGGLDSYNKLSQIDNIKIFLSATTNAVMAAAPLAEENKQILFAIATASTTISKAGDFIFRNTLLAQQEIKFLANSLNNMGYKKIGLLIIGNSGGESYRQALKKEFETLGGEIALTEKFEEQSNDFRTQLLKLDKSDATAIICVAHTQETGLILRQAKELGINKQIVGMFATEGPSLIEAAGEAADGVLYTHFFDPDKQTQLNKQYNQKYLLAYGRESEPYAALAYDNVIILAHALKNCDPDDTICIKTELYKIQNMETVTGKTSFDSNGDTTKEIILKTVRNGKFVLY